MIDREKVIKAVEDAFDLVHSDYIGTYDFDETEWEQNKADALAMLKGQETIRQCKDCKFYAGTHPEFAMCSELDVCVDSDFYCKYWRTEGR